MAYRFKRPESLTEGFERLALEEIQIARAALQPSQGGRPAPEQIHEARKAIKKLRALLRLCREGLGKTRFAAENAALRQIGRRLGGARDAEVHRVAFERFLEKSGEKISPRASAPFRQGLVAKERAALRALRLPPIRIALERLQRRLCAVTFPPKEWGILEGGLERAYQRARCALAQAEAAPTAENLHAWRRRTKDFWYQATLLQGAAPKTLRRLVDDLEKLGDTLGEEHDLAGLEPVLAGLARTPAARATLAQIAPAMTARRARLQRRVFRLGKRLFASKARPVLKAFARALRDWQIRST